MSRPGPTGARPSPEPDPERVLAQALRAMAGGGKGSRLPDSPSRPAGRTQLSVTQIILIATIFGLLIGMTVGLVSLLS